MSFSILSQVVRLLLDESLFLSQLLLQNMGLLLSFCQLPG